MAKSKIVLFSLSVVFSYIFLGCHDDLKRNTTVPYTPIDTRINLGWTDYQDLNFTGRPIYILYSTPAAKILGYNGNGIIVIKTDLDKYKCYDATCTNCIDADTHIEIIQGEQIARCPTCNIQFFLPYGIPLKREEENDKMEVAPLQEYPVEVAGNLLIIRY
ncbi:hypothetical protein [Odoribacter lunatus]|uniref:hypothetical protein n=1 Tax=Odoribacter lunatus TaxID=2941335 RepID=UPI00203EAD23|nr:hypothetical protein [Odoribacter lunatus]